MGIVEKKVAIVTGAARGIGEAISRRYVEEGAIVAMLDHDSDALAGAAGDLGPKALPYVADVSDEKAVEMAVKHIIENLGEIDILVNNAAAEGVRAKISDLSLENWEHALRINLTSSFLMSRSVMASMQRAGGGIIINIASQLASVAIPNNIAYCTTKGGVLQFTRALALDCAADNIRVNSISPGAVMTPRLQNIYGSEKKARAALAPKHPIGRIGFAKEIAGAALFLASPDSTFMTGSDVVVDGGYLAQ